jgi:hypothetical protein
MPSLDQLLEATMPFAATTKSPASRGDAPLSGLLTTSTLPLVIEPTEDEALNNPCWSWTHDGKAPDEFRDVACRVRGMGMKYMPMPVCESIILDRVTLSLPGSINITLPLYQAFLVKRVRIVEGKIPPASTGLWQLEANVDQSALVVFAFAITGSSVMPLTAAEIAKLGENFMPSPSPAPADATVGSKTTVYACPLRALVCFSLTCCKERPDFEPSRSLGANRIYPHVMVMTSGPVETITTSIIVKRPPKTPHTMSMPVEGSMLSDHMLPDIQPVFFTDSNSPSMLPIPLWDRLFDYYCTDPIGQGIGTTTPIVAVDPSKTGAPGTTRKMSGAIEHLTYRDGPPKPSKPFKFTKIGEYKSLPLFKAPRQGEFDNIHLAPPMSFLLGTSKMKSDRISMAPICIHDCLHTHWRWGRGPALLALGSDVVKPPVLGIPVGVDVKANAIPAFIRGFDASGTPYRVEGGPLVPQDQKVTVQLLSPSSYRYVATAAAPRIGSWSVFMHHGMAYANEIASPKTMSAFRYAAEAAADDNEEMDLSPRRASNSWAAFYWRLRWGGQDTPMERVRIPDLDAVRKF